ncbi:MAG: DUF4130 domain-containing protein [Promethearchaeota archaeon]|jgi:hypothetical protein
MVEKRNNQDPMQVVGCARGYSHSELIENLPLHSKSTPFLIEQIRKIPEAILRNSGTVLSKKVNKMMREVYTEAYRARQFSRTEINNRGVLYGVVSLKHEVIDLVLKYFHERFPQSIICLYNEHSHKTTTIDENGQISVFKSTLNEVVKKISSDRPIIPYFEDIQFTGEQIFETLYKSQFIPERENKEFFKRMIPAKCYELPGMRGGVEKRFRNKKIHDFF